MTSSFSTSPITIQHPHEWRNVVTNRNAKNNSDKWTVYQCEHCCLTFKHYYGKDHVLENAIKANNLNGECSALTLPTCKGDGACIEPVDNVDDQGWQGSGLILHPRCPYYCKPGKCPGYIYCQSYNPEWVYNTHNGFCLRCNEILRQGYEDSIDLSGE